MEMKWTEEEFKNNLRDYLVFKANQYMRITGLEQKENGKELMMPIIEEKKMDWTKEALCSFGLV